MIPVSYEVAKLAKEKGFDKVTLCAYCNKELESSIEFTGSIFFEPIDIENAEENGYECYLAPTQDQLLRWLREKYNVHIYTQRIEYEWGLGWIVCYNSGINVFKEISFHNYEEALEAGLKNILKEI